MGWKRLPRLDIASLTFFENVLEVGHALNICSSDIFVLSENGVDLTAEFLEHVGVSYKKSAAQQAFSETPREEYLNLQDIRHCRSCGISTRNKHVDNLVSHKSCISMMLTIEIIDECVFIRCVCVVLRQGVFDELVCV